MPATTLHLNCNGIKESNAVTVVLIWGTFVFFVRILSHVLFIHRMSLGGSCLCRKKLCCSDLCKSIGYCVCLQMFQQKDSTFLNRHSNSYPLLQICKIFQDTCSKPVQFFSQLRPRGCPPLAESVQNRVVYLSDIARYLKHRSHQICELHTYLCIKLSKTIYIDHVKVSFENIFWKYLAYTNNNNI